MALLEAQLHGCFSGVQIPGIEGQISHLFYADDTILLCPWEVENARRIVRILRCFFLASGLKINLFKSKLYGVGIKEDVIQATAALIGCISDSMSFIHLGVPVGQRSSRVAVWADLVDRFKLRLSGWKAKTLSIGGRLTLIKSVLGSIGTYFMSVFRFR